MKIMIARFRFAGVPLGAACLAFAPVLVAAPAAADAVADFYKDKQVRIIVGGTAGGGYAPYARMLQLHMGQYIPGKPQMVIQFMPGAGGLVATNFVYNVAPKDGTVIGAVQRSVVRLALLGDKQTQYDPSRINWVGSLHEDASVCVAWHTAPVKTFADAQRQELLVGAISPNNDTGQFPAVLNNILGTKFKIISGYSGSDGITIAIERGEVQARCGWSWGSLKTQRGDWLKEKQVNVLVQLSLRKVPEIGDVPLVTELAKTPEQKKTLEFIFAEQVMGKPFMMTAGVPAERVAAIRKAFMETARDQTALAQMASMNLEVSPLSGEEMEQVVTEQIKTPKDVVERAREALTYRDK